MRDKGGEGAEIGLGCKGLSLSKMTKMKGRVVGGGGGDSQWLGKSIWRKKGKEYLIQKPSLHNRTEVSGQNLWDTHIACDLKITRNFDFPVSDLPSCKGTAWLQRKRGRNRKTVCCPCLGTAAGPENRKVPGEGEVYVCDRGALPSKWHEDRSCS